MATPLRVLILGATSGIAEATARLYAAEGAVILLAGRNATRLAQIADDLKLRGASPDRNNRGRSGARPIPKAKLVEHDDARSAASTM